MQLSTRSAAAILTSLAVLHTYGCVPEGDGPGESAGKRDGALDDACSADPSAVDPDAALDAEEDAFLVLLNEYRAANQLPPLAGCHSLDRASQLHSNEMRDHDFFSHTDRDGGKSWHRACEACYEGACEPSVLVGENLAAGNAGAKATLQQWQGSPGHNANMLRAEYQVIGIGRATGGGTLGAYWTTVFGGGTEDSCL